MIFTSGCAGSYLASMIWVGVQHEGEWFDDVSVHVEEYAADIDDWKKWYFEYFSGSKQ